MKNPSKKEIKYSLQNIFLIFMTTSIIGYVWEVLFYLFRHGKFINCGTLYGPWLPIYGTGALLMLLLYKPLKDKPVLFFIVALITAGLLEYGIAWYLETFRHMRWWNYSKRFLNLHGRICLESLLLFSSVGTIFVYYGAPFLNNLFNKVKGRLLIIILIILLSIFSVDLIYSTIHPNTAKGVPIENKK